MGYVVQKCLGQRGPEVIIGVGDGAAFVLEVLDDDLSFRSDEVGEGHVLVGI